MDRLPFCGGRLCLDFVNTANWEASTPHDDRLTGLTAVTVWATRQGLLDGGSIGGDFAPFQSLRLAIRNILLHRAKPDDFATLNQARTHAPAVLRSGEAGPVLRHDGDTGWLLRVIAESTVEVLLNVDATRLKHCDGHRCGWLFIDESPNNRRRWCSMRTCGNRAKALRHYRRNRKS